MTIGIHQGRFHLVDPEHLGQTAEAVGGSCEDDHR